MSEKTYITKEQGRALQIGYDYKQCFHHESSQPKTMPEYTLVRAFLTESDYEQRASLEVLKFLYQFTFATHDQLMRFMAQKGLDTAGLDTLIQKLLDERKMNLFYLDRLPTDGQTPEDALVIYCMDFGAIAILTHFSNSDCASWFTTDSVRSSELICKYLSTTEFYLALAAVQGPNLRYFKPIFDVSYKHNNIRFSAAFDVIQGGVSHPFILESVRNFDLPVHWNKKLDEKITAFSCGEPLWAKFFQKEPVYLLLVENEEDALEAADLFHRRIEKDNIRLITDEQVQKGLANAYFLKYIPHTDPEKTGTLQRVRGGLLSGAAQ